ncbi:MAG TPA: NADH-quinone oxidoreductase subunit D [candidate division Zixibacteria bacterium]|jgi:NADH-quinone oxidoreductase subunit D|nr:NADH-quinone oxidoreductase subunit D [candidate division Zixibacteria bacterium]
MDPILDIKDLRDEEFIVNMGPQHPSTHGVLRLMLRIDGEFIRGMTPHVGYLHRSIEKIAENRTYNQFMPYTDRIDYCASMPCNQAWAVAIEKLAAIEVPERAEYIRVMMVELNRIASHLLYLGIMSLDLGAITPFLYTFREREQVLDLFEMTCGQRLTYNYIRIGGVARDLTPEFDKTCRAFLKEFRKKIEDYEAILTQNPIFLGRTKGVGVIPIELAKAAGVSGPTIRGSNYEWDIRKVEPYSVYPKFDFKIPTGKNGDVWDRYMVRIEEFRQSCNIIEQAINGLPEGDSVKAKLPAVFKPPKGEVFSRIEAPRGEMGYYVVSTGDKKPYRVKIRTASFGNLQVLAPITIGWKIADLVAIFGSLDVVLPEVDR